MKFDVGRADFVRGLDLIERRFHKEAGGDTAVPKQIDDLLDSFAMVDEIQAPPRW